MADLIDASTVPLTNSVNVPREREMPRLWRRISLAAILLLSIFMNFFLLGQNGYGNLYYAAGIRSMADSWHNFFFVSFDPGGFVTIDKPPLGFWLQTLSAKIFGFTPFSIFLPQAICGVLAVLLLYTLVRRHFGVVAGLVAALALAVSPISVVTDRNNTIDGTLALVLLLSAWAVIHAAEKGKLRWLLLSGLFVGIGFNIKMAEAYLVVPALGLTYLLCAPRRIWTRIWHLLLALLVMLVISLSWALAVDLTPAPQRPYVGSTQTNSELNLAFGYNGLNRLHIGNVGGRPGRDAGNAASSNRETTQSQSANTGNGGSIKNNSSSNTTPSQIPQFRGGGRADLLGLFGASMGGQIGWLLPFALLAIIALLWQRRFNFQQDRQQLGLVLWGCWLLTMAVFFTLDGSFHQYYMTEMAPGLSAMVGIGMVVMWGDYRRDGWRGWLLPIALALTAVTQIHILASYPAWSRWMSPLIGILIALVVIGLIVFRLRPPINLRASSLRIAGAVVSLGLLTLLIAPTIWAGYAVIRNVESSDPTAGPASQNTFGGAVVFADSGSRNGQRAGTTRENTAARNIGNLAAAFGAFGGGSGRADPALVRYLESHQGTAKFLVAAPNAGVAEPIILSTNKPVMAMGGFSGSDPILTTNDLQTLIKNGTVRFFLISSPRVTQQIVNQLPAQFRDLAAGRGNRQNALSTWVSNHCSAVPASDWRSSTGNVSTGLGSDQLYDCASAG